MVIYSLQPASLAWMGLPPLTAAAYWFGALVVLPVLLRVFEVGWVLSNKVSVCFSSLTTAATHWRSRHLPVLLRVFEVGWVLRNKVSVFFFFFFVPCLPLLTAATYWFGALIVYQYFWEYSKVLSSVCSHTQNFESSRGWVIHTLKVLCLAAQHCM